MVLLIRICFRAWTSVTTEYLLLGWFCLQQVNEIWFIFGCTFWACRCKVEPENNGGSGLGLSEFKMFIRSLHKRFFSNSSNNFEISHFPWGMLLDNCERRSLGSFFIRAAIRIGPKCSAGTSKRCKFLETVSTLTQIFWRSVMLEELETGWRANKISMFDWMTTWGSPKRDFKIATASS